MILDFHTHIFPDKIAKKTIEYLSNKGGIPPFSDGSVSGLLHEMEKANVNIAITLPVMTNPSQFETINHYASQINQTFQNADRSLISFAGIHPRCDHITEKMQWIKQNGFLGIKLHPDYQETFFDDDGYLEILSAAKALDLIVVTHAGVDVAYRGMPIRCTPDRAARVIDQISHPKLVLAHCGGSELFDEALESICGKNVYIDTAYVLRFIGKDTFLKMVQKHGSSRILFASDSPWSDMEKDVEILRSFGLDSKSEQNILYDNAKKLLNI